MTLLRATVLCVSIATFAFAGKALADDVFVHVDSVQGQVIIQLSGLEAHNVPVRPLAGDVLVGPLTIETGSDSNIDIQVRGNIVSISAGSSVVIESQPDALTDADSHSTYLDLGPAQKPWQTRIST